MRVLIQRVTEAYVVSADRTSGTIRNGLVVFVGVSREDGQSDADYLVDKLLHLRVFPDHEGKMNRNVQEAGGGLLIVSQFTLYANCAKGRRPNFDRAAPAEQAEALYNYFVERARSGPVAVETGVFQTSMDVHLVNTGPVTIWIDSTEGNRGGSSS
jgi:D-tyrosyl-tRNA(Tyr) deacylase